MAKPRRSVPHTSVATRAAWREMYEKTPYADLPWFSSDPSHEVVQAVEEGFFLKGGEVVDIGCGAGTHLLYLATRGFKTHGIDLSPGAIRAAQERAKKAGLSVDAREGDALALPFPRQSLDGAIDFGCFHTLPFRLRRPYARELYRVLRPEGRILISWVGRETTFARGPPHRPSLEEVAAVFEPQFLFERTALVRSDEEPPFQPKASALSKTGPPWITYYARLTRRSSPQPPRR